MIWYMIWYEDAMASFTAMVSTCLRANMSFINRKYVTYRSAARGGPSHGHSYNMHRKIRLSSDVYFRRYAPGQTNTQTAHHNTPFPYRRTSNNKRYIRTFGHSAAVFHVFVFYWLFVCLCFFEWHFIALLTCIAACLFNKLTYLLTYLRTHITPNSLAYFLELLVSLTNCIAFLLQVVGLHFVMPQ